jgi:hypothetical protein
MFSFWWGRGWKEGPPELLSFAEEDPLAPFPVSKRTSNLMTLLAESALIPMSSQKKQQFEFESV